tara:strand:- start:793 stop:1002 length:210 start_codon:yes stop_codon:yes gene_type:complete
MMLATILLFLIAEMIFFLTMRSSTMATVNRAFPPCPAEGMHHVAPIWTWRNLTDGAVTSAFNTAKGTTH